MKKLLTAILTVVLCTAFMTATFADYVDYPMYLYNQYLIVDSETELDAPEDDYIDAPIAAGDAVDEGSGTGGGNGIGGNLNYNPGTGR